MDKPRYVAGVLAGHVDVSYVDDWQREGIKEVPAQISWSYRLHEDGYAEPETTYIRYILLHGEWLYVPKLGTMLDAAFTGLMLDAENAVQHSCKQRFASTMRRFSASYWEQFKSASPFTSQKNA